MELAEIITVNYSVDYDMLYDEGKEPAECAELFTDLFERTMHDVLRGTDRDNVGGVFIYYRAGEPVAWFDYENMWGGLYE
jgi:hypothetical protein